MAPKRPIKPRNEDSDDSFVFQIVKKSSEKSSEKTSNTEEYGRDTREQTQGHDECYQITCKSFATIQQETATNQLTPEQQKRRKTALGPSELWKALDAKTEVQKMDQLLKLCIKRALSSRAAAIKEATNNSSGNLETLRFAKVVQDDLQVELDTGKISIDWNKRPASRAQVLNPNPQNEVNKRNCEELEARLRELESEKKAWEEQMAALEKEFGEVPHGPEPTTDSDDVKISAEDIAKLRDRLMDVERLVRELGDGTHRVDKVNAASRMFSDRKLQDMYSVLKAASPGDAVPSTQTLLRTLSRIA